MWQNVQFERNCDRTFGLKSRRIFIKSANEADWQRWADSFAQYQQTWQRQGILAMLQSNFIGARHFRAIIKSSHGRARLTDFLHLAEILQQAATLHESEAALLSWFEKQFKERVAKRLKFV